MSWPEIAGMVTLCASAGCILLFAAERFVERNSAAWIERAREASRGQ